MGVVGCGVGRRVVKNGVRGACVVIIESPA